MTCFSLFSKSVIRHFLKNPSGRGVDGLLTTKSVTREEKHFSSFFPAREDTDRRYWELGVMS